MDDEEFSGMSDPEFLAERRRVREAIAGLQERYARINTEFDRRATAKWKQEARCTSPAPSRP